MAGIEPCGKLLAVYRNQWPSVNSAYVTYGLSFDGYSEALHGGLGAYLVHDVQGDGFISNTFLEGVYAYEFQVAGNLRARAGFQVGYNLESVNTSGLIYPDMISISGVSPFSADPTSNQNFSTNRVDFSTGFVGFGKNYYLGLAIHHINHRVKKIEGRLYPAMARKYTLHGGLNILLGNKYQQNRLMVSPQLVIQKQGTLEQLNAGLLFSYSVISFGAWLRHHRDFDISSLIILIGFETGKYRLSYSYDYNLYNMFNQFGNAHEVTLSYRLPCREKNKKYRAISCPRF